MKIFVFLSFLFLVSCQNDIPQHKDDTEFSEIPKNKSAQNQDQSREQQTFVNKMNPEGFYLDISDKFFPSGWMGDGEQGKQYIQVNDSFIKNPHSDPTCYKWEYKPGGSKGWAAVAWQYPDGNWGTEKGRDLSGYKKLTFWIKGHKGGESLSIKIGGHTNSGCRYPASFVLSLGNLTLKNSWEQKEIDLQKELEAQGGDLSNVACAFAWAASLADNPDGCVFYLDDIHFEK